MEKIVEEKFVIDLMADFIVVIVMGLILILGMIITEKEAYILVMLFVGALLQFVVFSLMNLVYGLDKTTLVRSTITVLLSALLYAVSIYKDVPKFWLIGILLVYSFSMLVVSLTKSALNIKLYE